MASVNNYHRSWTIENVSRIVEASKGTIQGVASEPFKVFNCEGRLKLCWARDGLQSSKYRLTPSLELFTQDSSLRIMVLMSIKCAQYCFELRDEYPWTVATCGDIWSAQCSLEESEFLIDDSITIVCELVQLVNGKDKPPEDDNKETILEDIDDLSSKCDYLGMFREGVGTDFTIIVGDKEIACHKYILSTVSSIMDQSYGLKECKSIRLDEYDYQCMLEFVEFLYSLDETSLSLDKYSVVFLELSHVYDVPYLKAVCESYMLKSISQENARYCASLGIKFNANYLRRKAEEIILGFDQSS